MTPSEYCQQALNRAITSPPNPNTPPPPRPSTWDEYDYWWNPVTTPGPLDSIYGDPDRFTEDPTDISTPF